MSAHVQESELSSVRGTRVRHSPGLARKGFYGRVKFGYAHSAASHRHVHHFCVYMFLNKRFSTRMKTVSLGIKNSLISDRSEVTAEHHTASSMGIQMFSMILLKSSNLAGALRIQLTNQSPFNKQDLVSLHVEDGDHCFSVRQSHGAVKEFPLHEYIQAEIQVWVHWLTGDNSIKDIEF